MEQQQEKVELGEQAEHGTASILREHTHKKLLKSGQEGEGGSGLAQIAWSTFLLIEGIV